MAADVLITETKTKKSVDRRIFLLADAGANQQSMNCEGVNQILAQFREFSIRLDLISMSQESEPIEPSKKEAR